MSREIAKANEIVITGVRDFDPDQIFDCGQCFRWEKVPGDLLDGSEDFWQGIVGNHVSRVFFRDGTLRILDSRPDCSAPGADGLAADTEELTAFWRHYFDLDRDYGLIKERLSDGDPVMARAIEAGSGIRILNQPRWETLISFIISQNNNIPRIKKCIESVARTLGEPTSATSAESEGLYRIPSPRVLAKATEEDLAPCRLGYRSGYLIKTAGQICEDPEMLERLAGQDVSAASAALLLQELNGVGPKVANCVALFGLGKIDSFPIDVWMKRVMNSLYGIPEKNVAEMAAFAEEHFAPYGGIAQQYLFYYITHKM